MSRVLVTGGTGLVGRHVIPLLVARGDAVTALARSHAAAEELRSLGAEPVPGDLTDAAALKRAVAGAAAVVHAGAVVLSRGDWRLYEATNVTPTRVLARACAVADARLIHISSVAVYGRKTTYDGGASSVTEAFGTDRPLFPGDHYARSKREAEQALWDVARATGLHAVALRPCVIYGPGDRQFAVRVARVVRRGIAPLIGPGDNPLGVVYAGNVAAAVVAALDRPAATGPFNVANDGVMSARDFLTTFAEGMGVRLRLVRVPRAAAWTAARGADAALRLLRPRAPMTTLKTAVQFLSNPNPYVSARAERELEWRPAVAPREAVLRTARWFAAA